MKNLVLSFLAIFAICVVSAQDVTWKLTKTDGYVKYSGISDQTLVKNPVYNNNGNSYSGTVGTPGSNKILLFSANYGKTVSWHSARMCVATPPSSSNSYGPVWDDVQESLRISGSEYLSIKRGPALVNAGKVFTSVKFYVEGLTSGTDQVRVEAFLDGGKVGESTATVDNNTEVDVAPAAMFDEVRLSAVGNSEIATRYPEQTLRTTDAPAWLQSGNKIT